MPKFVRRESPPIFQNYRDYKPFLRRDFLRRCCYCGLRDFDGGEALFHIDHFRPKESFPGLKTSYGNLFYSCATCNRNKWDTWPSEEDTLAEFRFWHPCDDRSGEHFGLIHETGALESRSNCGRYTIDEIRLDRKVLRDLRLKRIERARRFREAVQARIEIAERLKSDALDDLVRKTFEESLRVTKNVIEQIRAEL